MNESETRAELIDPKLRAAGWGVVEGSRIRREVIAPGRVGDRARKPDIADYVLIYRNTKLAVIEAKRRDLPDTERHRRIETQHTARLEAVGSDRRIGGLHVGEDALRSFEIATALFGERKPARGAPDRRRRPG